MSQPNRPLLFYFLLVLLASAACAETRHHVSRYQLCRGCVPELAVTINGQTLGPTVHGAKGGTADVDVEVNGGLIANTYKARQGLALSAGHNGMVDVPEGPEAEPRVHATPTTPFTSYAMVQQSPGFNGTMAVEVDEAGPFAFRREHAVLHYDRRNRSTYEQAAAGLAFVALVCTDQISRPTICAVQGAAAYVTVENSPLTENVAIHWHGIRVTQGDTIVVTVSNSLLTENVAIDWHGIRQIGTEGVGMQRRSAGLNGRGRFDNCSTMASYNATHPQCSTPVFSVVPGKTYPFRIASVTLLSAFYFEVEPLTIDGPRVLRVDDAEITAGVHLGSSTPAFTVVPGYHGTSLSAHDFEIDQSHSDDGRAWFNWSLSVSGVGDAMRTGYSPPALAGTAGKMHHIVTTLSELSSDLLFDRTVQFTTASGSALLMMVHVALDDQRKKNKGGRDANFAKALLILLAIIAALLNPAMAARPLHGSGSGHDQAAVGSVAAAPVLMPQSLPVADHSDPCTNDPNTQDPYPCVHH